MTVEAARDVGQIRPIWFDTDASALALAAYDRLLQLLEQLEPEEWRAPTECPGWDVADMVGHLIGAARATASLREAARQSIWGRRQRRAYAGNDLDAMNALQVRDHAGLAPAERIAALRSVAPRAVRGRMRLPRALRGLRIPIAAGGSTAEGMPRSLTLGHLMAVIYTRDVWLHRVDIARATGRELVLDRVVDVRIVEDVVAEWATRHGAPFRLTLTGPAGGLFGQGADGPVLEIDAIEFCRALSGRSPGEGLLAYRVLF